MGGGKNGAVVRLLKKGLNHYGLGDLDAAIAAWEEARQLDPENRAVIDYLDTAYEESGRPPGGQAWVERTSLAAEEAASGVLDADDATPRSLPDVELQIEDPAGAGTQAGTARTSVGRGAAGPHDPRREPEPAGDGQADSGSGEATFSGLIDPDDPDTLLQDALQAYRDGRLEEAWGALGLAAQRDPSRLDLRAYQELIRNNLMEQWAREIGDQGRTLTVKLDMAALLACDLKPDEGFFLSQIDGSLTIENLIALSALDRFRTLEIISRLIREGIVE